MSKLDYVFVNNEWDLTFSSNAKLHLHMTLHVILCLDVAQENRALSLEELDLCKRLKRRVISLAVLERARKRQCARVWFLKDGDANTKFFHARVNGRRRKISFKESPTIKDGSPTIMERRA
jgi:hypothetical protein